MEPVEINAGTWYLRALRADDRVDDRPALAELGETASVTCRARPGQEAAAAAAEQSVRRFAGEALAVNDIRASTCYSRLKKLRRWLTIIILCCHPHGAGVLSAAGLSSQPERSVSGAHDEDPAREAD